MTMMINDHAYEWCTGEQSCPGVGYTDEETGKETCVSVAYCTSESDRNAYSYGEKRKCHRAIPKNSKQF